MTQQQNPALRALSLVLDDASMKSNTPADELLVLELEFRNRSDEPSPLPPAFFIRLGNGMEYVADTQGNITPLSDPNGNTNSQS